MNKASKTVLLALAAGLAACGESAVAPTNQATETPDIVSGGSTAALSGSQTLKFSFVIDPSRTTFYNLGAGNSITFPRASLCDPTKSSYGVGEWDKPCVAATKPLTVQATAWLDADGNPRIDFSPSIRFVPTTNPVGWVVLSFTDYAASWLSTSAITYCMTAKSACVNEAQDDPTMATVKDPLTGRLTRRVKHFSGYNVFSGSNCNDGSCDSDNSMDRTVLEGLNLSGRNP